MKTVLPIKVKNGNGSRKPGSVLASAAKVNAGKALESKQKRLGVYIIFGDETDNVLTALEAMRTNNNTVVIPGCFGDFDDEAASALALEKVTKLLEKAAAEK